MADRVRAVQGDADALADLVDPGSADLVLCHSVLEVVDSPSDVAAALAGTLRPGGAASVLVANRVAAALARAMGGQLDAGRWLCSAIRTGEPGSRDTVRRRFDVESATALLTKAGLVVEEVHGVRVVADLVPGGVRSASTRRSPRSSSPRRRAARTGTSRPSCTCLARRA